MKPKTSPIAVTQSPLTWGSRVTTCDCLMPGRINTVWKVGAPPATYFRVQFPPGSPFISDWAVYRDHEVALIIERPPLVNVNKRSIVQAMRPKLPPQ